MKITKTHDLMKLGNCCKSNLKTCCLICNSFKSGKTYEETTPLLLKSIKDRNIRNYN